MRTATPTTKPTITPTPRSGPVSAETQRSTSASGTINLSSSITTASGDSSFAYDGDIITFTLIATNNTGNTISGVRLLDELPKDTLDKNTITCSSACQR